MVSVLVELLIIPPVYTGAQEGVSSANGVSSVTVLVVSKFSFCILWIEVWSEVFPF